MKSNWTWKIRSFIRTYQLTVMINIEMCFIICNEVKTLILQICRDLMLILAMTFMQIQQKHIIKILKSSIYLLAFQWRHPSFAAKLHFSYRCTSVENGLFNKLQCDYSQQWYILVLRTLGKENGPKWLILNF